MDQPTQKKKIEPYLYFKRNSSSESFILCWIYVVCILSGIVTKGLTLIFFIPLLIYLHLQKEIDRIIFTPKEIKLLYENDSSHSKIYPVSDISFIIITISKALKKSYLDLDLELSDGKIKTIELNDFSPFGLNFQAHKIHSYCKEYYNIPTIIKDDSVVYTRKVNEF